jgi:hypothetical protein
LGEFVKGAHVFRLQKSFKRGDNSIFVTCPPQPDHLASARLSDYFDLSFAALPHKILLPEKFEEAVIDLRKRFTDRTRPDYVFKPVYHKRIPADGVAFYMEGIWVRSLSF